MSTEVKYINEKTYNRCLYQASARMFYAPDGTSSGILKSHRPSDTNRVRGSVIAH